MDQKILADFSNFSPKFFGPKLAENFFLLSKVGMGNKLYFINFFHLLLKKFRPFSDFTFKSKVLWFFSQGLCNRIFFKLVCGNRWPCPIFWPKKVPVAHVLSFGMLLWCLSCCLCMFWYCSRDHERLHWSYLPCTCHSEAITQSDPLHTISFQ